MPSRAVDIGRIWKDIDTLAGFTEGSGPGVTRMTFSAQDRAARQYLRREMEQAGLQVTEFAPGVMLGRLSGPGSSGPPVLSGSHIDTVLSAGRFDGVVGVVCALEVARVLASEPTLLRSPYEVVVYPEEEGTRFGAVLTGSKAWTGALSRTDLENAKDRRGTSYLAAMTAYGLRVDDLELHRLQRGYAKALIELHIEQSVVLEQRGIQVGIVTKIIGIRGFDVSLTGVANHAGATPMAFRHDALAGAAEIIGQLEASAPSLGPHTVCTVGQIVCAPGARNVIPGEVSLSIDFRDIEGLDDKWYRVEPAIRETARRRGLGIDIRPKASTEPVELSPRLQGMIENIAERRRLSSLRMPSGAVHDAQALAPLVETAMIFVPSRGGRSHCPEEYTEASQIEQGANVLLDTVLELST